MEHQPKQKKQQIPTAEEAREHSPNNLEELGDEELQAVAGGGFSSFFHHLFHHHHNGSDDSGSGGSGGSVGGHTPVSAYGGIGGGHAGDASDG